MNFTSVDDTYYYGIISQYLHNTRDGQRERERETVCVRAWEKKSGKKKHYTVVMCVRYRGGFFFFSRIYIKPIVVRYKRNPNESRRYHRDETVHGRVIQKKKKNKSDKRIIFSRSFRYARTRRVLRRPRYTAGDLLLFFFPLQMRETNNNYCCCCERTAFKKNRTRAVVSFFFSYSTAPPLLRRVIPYEPRRNVSPRRAGDTRSLGRFALLIRALSPCCSDTLFALLLLFFLSFMSFFSRRTNIYI